MDFYHVARAPLQTNQIINLIQFDNLENNYNILLNRDDKIELQSNYPDGISHFGIENLLIGDTIDIKKINKHQYELENHYEFTRRKHFPKSPSRFTSFFACNNINDAYEFKSSFGKNSTAKIYKVECKSFFRADMNLLFYVNEHNNKAHNYWGNDISEKPFFEYLLVFPIKIKQNIT